MDSGMKRLKKMLNYAPGGQVPGQEDSSSQPGQDTTVNNTPGVDNSSATQTQPGQSSSVPVASQSGTSNAQAKTGTGFTNIQKLIGANTNNQLGNAVGQGVQNTAQNAQNNINQAQNDFTTQSNAANQNTQANRDYINNTYQGIQAQAGVPGAVNPTAGNNPNYTPSQDDTTKFQTFNSGQYTGPTQMAGVEGLQSQAQDVNNLQGSLNSQEGRQGLLQRFVGNNGQYTQGEQNLDAMLLGQTGGQQLNQARLAAQQLPDLNNLQAANAGAVQTLQNQAKDLANYTQSGAKSSGAAIQQALNNQAATQNTANDVKYNSLMSDLQSGKLNADDAGVLKNILGLDPDAPIYGTKDDIMKALTGALQRGPAYTASSVDNGGGYAAQQALQKLSGLDPSGLGLNIDQSKIGTGGSELNIDPVVQAALLKNQKDAATQFQNSYKDSGILSQQELDYINSLRPEFGAVSTGLNNINSLEDEARYQNINNINAKEQQIKQQLADYDKSQGQSGFGRYNDILGHLENYGGKRSQHQGEGVSAFLANLDAQQKQRQDLEKQNNYFNNLQSLLGSGNAS
jgi:hypothetical protein